MSSPLAHLVLGQPGEASRHRVQANRETSFGETSWPEPGEALERRLRVLETSTARAAKALATRRPFRYIGLQRHSRRPPNHNPHLQFASDLHLHAMVLHRPQRPL